jgi:RNase P/RNase MRP subunit p29
VSFAPRKLHGKYMSLDRTVTAKSGRPAVQPGGAQKKRRSKAVRVGRASAPCDVPGPALREQHQAWAEYARGELRALQTQEPALVAQMLLGLDRHGCELRVARSRCPSHASLAGIVLVETRHTLVLQGDDGARRRVPKAGSTFALTLPAVDGKPPLVVSMRGDELR